MNDESLETLFCALFYLLSRQAHTPESHLPPVIHDHLQRIARHPGTEALPVLRSTADRLARHWDRNGPAAEPQPVRAGRLH
jgi:hypothetical protein